MKIKLLISKFKGWLFLKIYYLSVTAGDKIQKKSLRIHYKQQKIAEDLEENMYRKSWAKFNKPAPRATS